MTMGRTKRKRNRKKFFLEYEDQLIAIRLQKSIKLKCSNLKIGYFNDTGRGVLCKRKIHKGDILIALPLNNLITPKVDCQLFSQINIENLSPQLILSTWLVYEDHLGENSHYVEYIQSLPKYYTNLYFCTENESNLLPEYIKKEWVMQIIQLQKILMEFLGILNDEICVHCKSPLKNIYTQKKLIWAWFTVNTRSVYYEDYCNTKSLALAPFLDMFNHSNDAETEMVIDYSNGYYILKTLVEYKKYDQVFIKYGAHSNLKLLIEYGFVIPENPHDFVEFTFEDVIQILKEKGFNYGDITKLKYNFIKENNLSKNLSKNKEEFSWNLNGLLYVLTSKDQDISVMLAKIYSHNFSPSENKLIKKIEETLASKKLKDLSDSLIKMEDCTKSSESFKVVKQLIKIYINLLQCI